MSPERLTSPGVRVTVQRHITDEETICFEGFFGDTMQAEQAAASQLKLCRDHMVRYNEDVHLVHEKTLKELEERIATKGEELKKLTADHSEMTLAIQKAGKKLAAVG